MQISFLSFLNWSPSTKVDLLQIYSNDLLVSGNSTFLLCSLGNPYVAGSKDRIDITLDVSSLSDDTKEVGLA